MKSNVFKTMSKILVGLGLGTFIILTFTACGQSQNLSGAFGQNSQNPFKNVSPDVWAHIDTQGSASNLMGTQGFTIDKNTGMLKVSFDLPANPFGGAVSYPIQQIPGASVSIDVNPANGKWQLTFNIPISALVRGIGPVQLTTLPNGDPLPGVPGGEPPRVGARITKGNLDMYVYGNVKYFALYYPTPQLDKYMGYIGNWVFPIKNKDKTKILGYFATVMPKNGFSSGLFISVVFPPELSALLDMIF